MIKIIGLVGSPRRGGNTEHLVKVALVSAGELGVDTELINLGSSRNRTMHCL